MTVADATDETPLLSVRRLTKTFSVDGRWRARKLDVLRDVSFDVHAGEVVALVGESGSGKSTTARLIARLLPPSAGEIRFKGDNVLQSQPRRPTLAYRAHVQMIFQDPFSSLNPLHTIRYHLERPLRRHGKAGSRADLTTKVHRLLETVGLTPAEEFADKHPHQASGGQRQRVAIARALAVDPELILADEPTSMLDVSIRIDLLNLMRDLKVARRIGYLFITHDLGSARYFADRILVMYAGQIVESASSEALLDAPAHPYTQLLVAAVPSADSSIATGPVAAAGSGKPTASGVGCPFAERCPSVMDRCRTETPAAREVAPGHTASCHLY
ncbi:MAG TPA: ABC transporter ATP-binding protein [Polyangia bacterium]|jgi:peptide/nickel transport system ATP-binding protein|nr:ABC transporter ATP-binding protein [Polyangia bacterium]